MELKKRILSSVEAHKKLTLRGLVDLFPHEKLFTVLRNVAILKGGGMDKSK